MKLFFSGASPFARKVMVTAIETGQEKAIEKMPVATTPVAPNPDLSRANPVAKLPALITDDGETLYDSVVICEYLDSLHNGRKLIPASGAARWRVLTLHALADGITDAALLCRYEGFLRPAEKRWDDWRAGQLKKVHQGLDALDRNPALLDGDINLGQIGVACAIGYIEFREVDGDIRKNRPALGRWYEKFAARPSMQATAPQA